MNSKKGISTQKRNLILWGVFIALFAALMIYALNQNPNFTSSALVGHEVPTFQGNTTDGKIFDSKNIFNHNRWVIVNFWTTSCYVCRSEAPALEDFYRTVTLENKKNPYFLSVNINDSKNSIAAWQKNYSQTFPVLQDKDGFISINFGVTGTPETFFVNPNGIVRYRISGEITKETIVSLVSWLDSHPQATESEISKALYFIYRQQ